MAALVDIVVVVVLAVVAAAAAAPPPASEGPVLRLARPVTSLRAGVPGSGGGHAVVPRAYPLFKQCNASWGDDVMVTKTICQVGCLMCSVSMSLRGHNITIPPALPADCRTLNAWLKTHGGYDADNDLKEAVVPQIAPQRVAWVGAFIPQTKLDPGTVRQWLESPSHVVIANVMHGHHFVLVVGYDSADSDVFYVNDPGFSVETYSYKNDIVGWRVFTMS